MSLIPPTPFRLKLLARARHYAEACVKEQGNNRGRVVEHIQRATKTPPGSKWCASAVVLWALEALDITINKLDRLRARLKDEHFLPSASVQEIVDDAKRRGTFRKKNEKAEPGWLVVFRFPTGNHIGVVKADRGRRLETIEGNTGSGSDRDGDGVYERDRAKTYVRGYVAIT